MMSEERVQEVHEVVSRQLALAGWIVQNYKTMSIEEQGSYAIQRFPLTTGTADYLLIIDSEAVGLIVLAKSVASFEDALTTQARYRIGQPVTTSVVRFPRSAVPFTYAATEKQITFTNYLEPDAQGRSVFFFHRPKMLQDWLRSAPADVPLEKNELFRARLRSLPVLPRDNLRSCQYEAITKLEQSLVQNRRYSLIQMATGSGKTYMMVQSIYRLIKYGNAQRVLFLVDRNNLAVQAYNAFENYETPEDDRPLFTKLYGVQHLHKDNKSIASSAKVCIMTIQRLFMALKGNTIDFEQERVSMYEQEEQLEDGSGGDTSLEGEQQEEGITLRDTKQEVKVEYNPAIPIETFDVIVIDECHRSIYNLWQPVLKYFDAFVIGLTATPDRRTFAFFENNLVMRYSYEQSVAEGVNVDYSVWSINTEVTSQGATIPAGAQVETRNLETLESKPARFPGEVQYTQRELDREVVCLNQIKTVLTEFRDGWSRIEMFRGRNEVPKTLIFAKNDVHASDIVEAIRDVFNVGNDFVQKITYNTPGNQDDLIRDFRNNPYPRIAVTVDMIATGTDIKPLEMVMFMRLVRSSGYYEQMRGRGVRTIKEADFRKVTLDARQKTGFVVVDAVGVTDCVKDGNPPLDRNPSESLEKLLNDLEKAYRQRDYTRDVLVRLAGRLGRLTRFMKPEQAADLQQLSDGRSLEDLAAGLIRLAESRQASTEGAQSSASRQFSSAATASTQNPLTVVRTLLNPALVAFLLRLAKREAQIMDLHTIDRVLTSQIMPRTRSESLDIVDRFQTYIRENPSEFAVFELYFQQPPRARLTLKQIKELIAEVEMTDLVLTTSKVWQAYYQLNADQVRGASNKRIAADFISLIRYTMELERGNTNTAILEPFQDVVNRRFDIWLSKRESERGKPFDEMQRTWLNMMRDHITASLDIEEQDFNLTPFNKCGDGIRVRKVFGAELPTILQQLNERLAS